MKTFSGRLQKQNQDLAKEQNRFLRMKL